MASDHPALLLLIFTAVYHIGLFGIPDVVLNFYYVSLGYTTDQIALFQSIPRIGGVLTGLPVGYIATRLGERNLILGSTFGAALALALLVIVPTTTGILIGRFLLGFLYGAGQIALPVLMVRLVRPERVNSYFAAFNIVGMSFTAIGSVIGGYLPGWIAGGADSQSATAYGGSLLICAGIMIIGVLPLIFVPEVNAEQRRRSNRLRNVPWRLIVRLSLPMLVFGFTGGLTFPFYNLFFRDTFALSDIQIGQVIGFGWIGMALIPMLSPPLARRVGNAQSLAILMTIAAVAFFGLSLSASVGALILSIITYVIAVSARNCMQPLFQPLQMGSLPPELRNIASSAASVIWNLGWFGATIISGVLQTQYGYPTIMMIVAAGVFVSGLMVMHIYRHVKPVETPPPAPA
ncbi:MFS transporter [Anaerolineae bacterium CFX9]|nr:MFS transporter [Anaerolineae bacterium CFX9]